MNNQLIKLIEKYLRLYLELIEPRPRLKNEASLEERYITTTDLVPHDFFEDKSTSNCNKNISYREFGNSYIIFNDLKNSTSILEECESVGKECIYVGYIYYTSKLLADILDLIGGKIVEITGDGNYSIIKKIDFKDFKFGLFYDGLEHLFINFNAKKYFKSYQRLFDELELHGLNNDTKKHEKLRQLIFCIFAVFNIQVNKKLKVYQYNFDFAMRVGCEKGDCKITRFDISNHIRQDKLIGSVVNQAAHQAMGK